MVPRLIFVESMTFGLALVAIGTALGFSFDDAAQSAWQYLLLYGLSCVLLGFGVLYFVLWERGSVSPATPTITRGELARELQDWCDKITTNLRLHRCPRGGPMDPAGERAAHDDYYGNLRNEILPTLDRARRAGLYDGHFGPDELRVRIHGPANAEETWQMVDSLSRDVIAPWRDEP